MHAFRPLDKGTIDDWANQWLRVRGPSAYLPADWRDLEQSVNAKKNFERRERGFGIAIYHGVELCALAMGDEFPNPAGFLSIDYMEGAPFKHALTGKLIPLFLDEVEAITRRKRLTSVRVVSPRLAIRHFLGTQGYREVSIPHVDSKRCILAKQMNCG